MARTIATITGTALRPGVSKNKRWYKPEHVAGAVQRAQERLAAGDKPMVMLTFHEAGDASREIAASLTGMRLAEDGSAEFEAGFTDTAAGWDIAKLADTSDGKPAHLKNVSIRGSWTGKVRKERGPGGQAVETADGLELEGIDFTKAPGVDGAEIKTFSWALDGQNETSGRVLITESVEATVTVTEETPATETAPAPQVPEGVREALAALLPVRLAEADNATPAISKRGSGMSGAGRKWADPGYQADHKQRYDITTKAKAIAGWRYINQASKAAKYTSSQLKNIKARIRAALKGFGVKTAAEGWVIEPAFQVTEAVAEFYGDPARSGSWCVTASNGPVSLNLSCYGMDPADMDVILRAAAGAACDALKALDPDMDGDIDVAGVGDGSDTDGDAGHESAPEDDPPATETTRPEAGGEDPAEAGTSESEVSAMPEDTATTTEAGAGAPAGLTPEALAKLVAESSAAAARAALEQYDADRKERKKAAAAETTAAEAAAPAAGTEGGTVAETQEDREKRLIGEALAAAGVKPPVAETQEDREKRLIAEALKAAGVTPAEEVTEADAREAEIQQRVQETVQGLVAAGAILPGRSGIVVREHATDPDEAKSAKDLAGLSDDDFNDYAGRNLDKYVGDRTRIQALHT